jgi:hypothetical protein
MDTSNLQIKQQSFGGSESITPVSSKFGRDPIFSPPEDKPIKF